MSLTKQQVNEIVTELSSPMTEQQIEEAVRSMEFEISERWEQLKSKREDDEDLHKKRFKDAELVYAKHDKQVVYEANGVFPNVKEASMHFPGFVIGWLADLIELHCERAGDAPLRVTVDPFIDVEHEHVEGEEYNGYRFSSKAAFVVEKVGV